MRACLQCNNKSEKLQQTERSALTHAHTCCTVVARARVRVRAVRIGAARAAAAANNNTHAGGARCAGARVACQHARIAICAAGARRWRASGKQIAQLALGNVKLGDNIGAVDVQSAKRDGAGHDSAVRIVRLARAAPAGAQGLVRHTCVARVAARAAGASVNARVARPAFARATARNARAGFKRAQLVRRAGVNARAVNAALAGQTRSARGRRRRRGADGVGDKCKCKRQRKCERKRKAGQGGAHRTVCVWVGPGLAIYAVRA